MIKEKDIKFIGKQFKLSDKSLLDVNKIYLGFVKGDGSGLISSHVKSWSYFEEELQELILKNLKKAYTGKVDEKIFSPEFVDAAIQSETSTYSILKDITDVDDSIFKKKCEQLCERISEKHIYDTNIVFVGALCAVHKDGVRRPLFVSTICEVTNGKVNFVFKGTNDKEDVFDEQYALHSSLDSIINLQSPIDGISYPVLTDGTAYKNRVLYYSKKKNKPNTPLMSNVIECNIELTAEQEKIFFNSILNEVAGGKMSGRDLFTIYDHLRGNFTEEDDIEEEIQVEKYEIKKALEKADIKQVIDLDDAFKKVFGFEDYTFKIGNILPNKDKKSITISNEDANIQVKPDLLKDMKQIQDENGQVFLMIPLSEEASTNGIVLPTEEL